MRADAVQKSDVKKYLNLRSNIEGYQPSEFNFHLGHNSIGIGRTYLKLATSLYYKWSKNVFTGRKAKAEWGYDS